MTPEGEILIWAVIFLNASTAVLAHLKLSAHRRALEAVCDCFDIVDKKLQALDKAMEGL